jgi:hypothetical protein
LIFKEVTFLENKILKINLYDKDILSDDLLAR